ncbi:hypothetical protein [Streptacidiphilus jiangxiensis]|uniref:Uncharacterized protein n=1 Tax=Streptacidiphilus jiangxiensis TaxID=235985 RepID=A0A1H7HZI7_STRJI|nr:hypothetical protein [Streptacidiphilus jiangxiensis]SEK55037.1 hypothetical protein SAMN05414137_102407 [Streptacidiphilus jiangxiensis]
MTKVKNQPRKQKQSAARTPSRAQTHDKAMLAEMKAGQHRPEADSMDASGEMAMRSPRKKEKRFGHN